MRGVIGLVFLGKIPFWRLLLSPTFEPNQIAFMFLVVNFSKGIEDYHFGKHIRWDHISRRRR